MCDSNAVRRVVDYSAINHNKMAEVKGVNNPHDKQHRSMVNGTPTTVVSDNDTIIDIDRYKSCYLTLAFITSSQN